MANRPPERRGDPPGQLAQAAPARGTTASVILFGRHTSVQVNVDALGNNIFGDAANEPSIAIDPTNPMKMAIGWRQFDTIFSNFRQAGVAHSVNGGQTWIGKTVIDPGRFRSDPVLGHDGFGNFYYSSLTHPIGNENAFEVHVFKSSDGGATWSSGVYAFGGDKQWMAVDDRASGPGAGFLYQYWTPFYSCCGFNDFTRSVNGGASFEPAISLPDPRIMWGTLDMDSYGVLYAVGRSLDGRGHLFTYSTNALNMAVTPTFAPLVYVHLDGFTGSFGDFNGPNPAGLLGQVWVATNPAKPGHVYVLGSVIRFSDPVDVMFARSVDGGATWSPPVRVNDDPIFSGAWQWFGTMSVASNGRIDVAWNDTRNMEAPNFSAVFYSFSMDEGQTWSPNEQITPVFNSHVGFPNQYKIGDYSHMISDNGGANLAYAATFNGEQDVYFVRIRQDCNANGIEDDCETQCTEAGTRCDVAGCGTKADCNNNRVPDECEPNQDCNENLTRDLCEIGLNPALDCNSNRILDLCESAQDCNGNGAPDICDLFVHGDCNSNGVPDDCDVASGGGSDDKNGDGAPDECLGACCDCVGCRELSAEECFFIDGSFSGLGTICGQPGSCVPGSPEHDFCISAVEIPSAPYVREPFDNRCSFTDGPSSLDCPSRQPIGADLWYHYIAPCSGTVAFDLCEDTDYDAMLAVYGGGDSCTCPSAQATPLICGDDTCGYPGGPPLVTLGVFAGECFTLQLGGWRGEDGAGSLIVRYVTACNPTDLSGDGSTDLRDFAGFENCFGSLRMECTLADFNHNGTIDLRDFRALGAMWHAGG